jgi:hypothetical protein
MGSAETRALIVDGTDSERVEGAKADLAARIAVRLAAEIG